MLMYSLFVEYDVAAMTGAVKEGVAAPGSVARLGARVLAKECSGGGDPAVWRPAREVCRAGRGQPVVLRELGLANMLHRDAHRAEVGNMAPPQKILQKGITDMVRSSDARMSGTAYDAVVLHTAPEAAMGGPLALVRNGDGIELDVEARKLHLDMIEAELEKRRKAWTAPAPHDVRGYVKLYCETVNQADQGVDLEFLVGKSGAPVPRESH